MNRLYSLKLVFTPEVISSIMLIAFLLPLAVAVLFGRVFCGYICPASAIVNFNLKIQKKYFKRSPQYSGHGSGKWSTLHYVFFALTFTLLFLNPVFIQYVLPPAILQHAVSDFILFGGFSLWLMLFLVFIIFEIAQPAYFCRKLCPTGMMLTLLGKKRVVSLQYQKGVHCATNCHLCNEKCWLGLAPKNHATDSACDLCQRCVTV